MDSSTSDGIVIPAHSWVRRVIVACLVFEVVLVVLDLIFNVQDVASDLSIRRIFNLAREESLPTWFASTQAVAAGMAALLLAWLAPPGRARWAWVGVGAFLVYVGADDAAEIHERVGSAIGRAVEDGGGTWVTEFPSYAWQLFVAPVLALALLGSVAWGMVQATSRAARGWLVVTVLCFGGSQALDFVEGIESLEPRYEEWADRLGVDEYTVTHALKVVEEWLEMIGTTGLLASFLLTGADALRGRTVRFSDDPA